MESAQKEFERLIVEKQNKLRKEQEKYIRNFKRIYISIELILILVGYGLITYFSSFFVALGIFLVLWSNNMGQGRLKYKQNEEIWKDIWK